MSDKLPRTDSTQAMKSIFSAYQDDEEGGGETSPPPPPAPGATAHFDDDNISGSDDEGSTTRSMTPIKQEKRAFDSYRESPLTLQDDTPKKAKLDRKSTRLVSYGPDEAEEEEEEDKEEDEEEGDDMGLSSEVQLVNYDDSFMQTDLANLTHSVQDHPEDDVKLPPEPPGKCSKHLQEKINNLYRKMHDHGANLINSIQNRKDFRNPSIYEKLLEFCAIDEKGTNYPPDLYNPGIWGEESYYDELAKVQKVEMDKREKEKKERTKVEFVIGTKKSSSDSGSEQRRKSKWDTQNTAKPAVITTTAINPPVISVATSSSGHKTTVISAVGTIKKPK